MDREERLIAEARSGSVRAFTELIAGYREGLFRFLLVRCRSRADAEDALQEALVNAYRYLHTYDDRWRFSTWLYRIAIRRAGALARSADAPLDPALADPSDSPLEVLVAADERENLWRVARRVLGEEVYAAVWLRYVEEMSMQEIADTLDRTVSWAKVNLHRAREALDAELTRMESKTHG